MNIDSNADCALLEVMRYPCFICLLASFLLSIAAAETSGNPLFDGWYADPEIITIGDEYWLFPTFSAPFEEQLHLDAFSSPDLVTWTKHARVIDNKIITWAQQAMWAPCPVEKEGRYYLFFAANDPLHPGLERWTPDFTKNHYGGIGIAVADHPGGPYRDYLGKPLLSSFPNGAQPIDQYVFRDNGQWFMIYGGWGVCNLTRLKDDFTGFQPWPDGSYFKEVTPEGYVEGPVIFQRQSIYYFMWSEGNWTRGNYRVNYATADNLLGPWQPGEIVLEAEEPIATGPGHHSVLNVPGTDEWYIVYHRRPIPNESPHHRVTCIDRMEFDTNGRILPIQMTFEGIPARPLR